MHWKRNWPVSCGSHLTFGNRASHHHHFHKTFMNNAVSSENLPNVLTLGSMLLPIKLILMPG